MEVGDDVPLLELDVVDRVDVDEDEDSVGEGISDVSVRVSSEKVRPFWPS